MDKLSDVQVFILAVLVGMSLTLIGIAVVVALVDLSLKRDRRRRQVQRIEQQTVQLAALKASTEKLRAMNEHLADEGQR